MWLTDREAAMSMRRFTGALGLSALLLAGACAPTKVQSVQSYAGPTLPRPQLVVVNDFSTVAADVTLDSGIGARLKGAIMGAPANEDTLDARKVTDAISQTLANEIDKLGIPVIRADAAAGTTGNRVIIGGRINSIDEGNRTRRNFIGFGAGKSEVDATATVYYQAVGETTPRLLQTFEGLAQSGRKPGAAETMGAGAAAGRIATSAVMGAGASVASETMSAGVDDDSERMAKELAEQLKKFFMDQGWIPLAK
jgi:hypothetical protein